jgi:hypothetical protein
MHPFPHMRSDDDDPKPPRPSARQAKGNNAAESGEARSWQPARPPDERDRDHHRHVC